MAVLFATSVAFAQAGPARAESRPEALPTTQQIVDEKTHIADLYDAYLRGEAGLLDLRRAEQHLSRMTGERVSTPLSSRRFELGRAYTPFRQATSYYCGPATVESILWFLGVPDRGSDGPRLTGIPEADQSLLATDGWLGTESMEGTAWGDIVPDTINQWRGTRWYAAFATPNVGGSLTQDQAMKYIQYAIDHGHPVAANVIYSPGTVTPAGFAPGHTYQHWETIVGYFDRDGRRYVRIGESYGAPGIEYVPVQEIPWDDYWPAIGNWYGLVW